MDSNKINKRDRSSISIKVVDGNPFFTHLTLLEREELFLGVFILSDEENTEM